MKYRDIRKFSYRREKKFLATDPINFDIDRWSKSPYTCLKVRFYIELSCIFVYFLQYTKVKPNHVSYLYAFSGIIAGILLGSNNSTLLIIGIFLFFSKVAIDGTDGLLSRVKYKPTKFGALLDDWGGLVGEYSFIFGLGFYLFNQSGNEIYIFFATATGFLKAIDIKNYGNKFFKNSNFLTADVWSNFLDSSIKGQTQKIWFPKLISFLINLITSPILLSSLLYVLIGFLDLGFSLIIDTSISPYIVIVKVLGIGVAVINKTSQSSPPLSESFFL